MAILIDTITKEDTPSAREGVTPRGPVVGLDSTRGFFIGASPASKEDSGMAEKDYLRNAELLEELIIQAISPMEGLISHLKKLEYDWFELEINRLLFPLWDLTKKNLQTLVDALEDSLGRVKLIVAPKPDWYNEMPRYCFGKVLLDNEFYKKPKKEDDLLPEETSQIQEQPTA
ncbi:MAG: hypothetical protein JRI66_12330 [Deltaproteobacteria bacterium]|nr:hypothetical protein [Deltaproteobacteria bacterium]